MPGWRGDKAPGSIVPGPPCGACKFTVSVGENYQKTKHGSAGVLPSCQREAAGCNWHMCDVTSPKWGVTSLQLVRFSGVYKTDHSEATVWKRKTWSQFTKHNLFQALCCNKQSSSGFSNTQPVGSSVLMGVLCFFFFSDCSAKPYLNAKFHIHKYWVGVRPPLASWSPELKGLWPIHKHTIFKQ